MKQGRANLCARPWIPKAGGPLPAGGKQVPLGTKGQRINPANELVRVRQQLPDCVFHSLMV